MFVDVARIHIKAGGGGKGCDSFNWKRSGKRGKANGGGGGNGGNVIIKIDPGIHTLLDFQYRRHFKAHSGTHGSSNNKRGHDGQNCVIKVPGGTVVRDGKTGDVLRDLVGGVDEVIIARGGQGGRGNSKKSAATPGQPGDERDIVLELKLIADVGIVGYPNAGKSTFISRVSKARPKIASYPFTTKEPVLGVAAACDINFVIADIPGLIEGAAEGKGLGHKFLRHVERTKILLHLIDAASVDGRDPLKDYHSLNKELALYGRALTQKPQVIAANKMDLAQAKENYQNLKANIKEKVYPVSALTGEGLKELLSAIAQKL